MKALRYNNGKPQLGLLQPDWLFLLAEVLAGGALKYAVNNWMNSINTDDHDAFVNDRLESAMRHILAHMQGEELDMADWVELSQLGYKGPAQYHVVKAAINLLFVATYCLKKEKK